MSEPLVTIENLKTWFFTEEGTATAVDDVSLTIPKGKTLGLVGESGCGKSVTAMSILQLIAHPGRIVDGHIRLFDSGRLPSVLQRKCDDTNGALDLTTLTDAEMRSVRGGKIAMIFQEPMSSLNPVFKIGHQIVEAIRLHQPNLTSRQAHDLAVEMLRRVKIPEPERRYHEYPHQFSGGMRQRAMIAMALSCNPSLLIADEPTTALDVTIQAQIIDLLLVLQAEQGMSILLITHDLGLIAETADEVAVMYASKVVEQAPIGPLFENPLHPYTMGLFASRPDMSAVVDDVPLERLKTIEGMVPSPIDFPTGCKFHPRCRFAKDRCRCEEPQLREIEPGHTARCHFAGEI